MLTTQRMFIWDIVDGEMRLNDAGIMVNRVWNDLPVKHPGIEMDEFIVMPNHIHGIIVIVGAPLVGAHSLGTSLDDIENRAGTRPWAGTRPAPTLGDIVGEFKSITTYQYAKGVVRRDWLPFSGKLWQRNYYEHVIRNENDSNRIRQYIVDNPLQWVEDEDNPANINCRGNS